LTTKQITSAAIFLGTGCLLFAAEAPHQDELTHKVQVSETKRIAFPQGSTLRFRNSVGVLTVEAWDRPEVEITTIKSTKTAIGAGGLEKARQRLDKVSVSAGQQGGELVVTTTFPRHRPFGLPYPLSGNTGFDLEYRVKAPASARIVADHTLGEVNIDGVAGDIEVTVAQGQILLHLQWRCLPADRRSTGEIATIAHRAGLRSMAIDGFEKANPNVTVVGDDTNPCDDPTTFDAKPDSAVDSSSTKDTAVTAAV